MHSSSFQEKNYVFVLISSQTLVNFISWTSRFYKAQGSANQMLRERTVLTGGNRMEVNAAHRVCGLLRQTERAHLHLC